jgi:hypothetical protein
MIPPRLSHQATGLPKTSHCFCWRTRAPFEIAFEFLSSGPRPPREALTKRQRSGKAATGTHECRFEAKGGFRDGSSISSRRFRGFLTIQQKAAAAAIRRIG